MKIDSALLRASWHAWLSTDAPRAGPAWWQWGWTVAWAFALALLFTLVGMAAFARGGVTLAALATWFARNLVVCLTISLLIHGLFAATQSWSRQRLASWASWQRTAYFSGIPLLGVLLGWPVGVSLAGGDLARWLLGPDGWRVAGGSLLISVVITFVVHHYFAARAREIEARQQAAEAQLRLLQAQIEPHFLFNTLANVQALIDHDAATARQMLGAFTDYLRGALQGMRRDEVTLADELALAEAYLRVQQVRMVDRLQVDVQADAEARQARLPPFLLQPLVENAVQHGLEPQIDGGTVRVRAHVRDGRLDLEVRDDGRGLHDPVRPGAGVAVANIRERLAARYGSHASLSLVSADPGTCARLSLPVSDLPP